MTGPRGAVYYAWVIGTRDLRLGEPQVLIFSKHHRTSARDIAAWRASAGIAFGDDAAPRQPAVREICKVWIPEKFAPEGQGALYQVGEANRRVLVWDDVDAGSTETNPDPGGLRTHESREVPGSYV